MTLSTSRGPPSRQLTSASDAAGAHAGVKFELYERLHRCLAQTLAPGLAAREEARPGRLMPPCSVKYGFALDLMYVQLHSATDWPGSLGNRLARQAESARDDWVRDTEHLGEGTAERTLDEEALGNSLLELADVWTEEQLCERCDVLPCPAALLPPTLRCSSPSWL